jgi:hypothetical protein
MTCSQALQPLTRVKMLVPIPQPPNPKISDAPKNENAVIIGIIEKFPCRKEIIIKPLRRAGVEISKRLYST